MKPRVGIIGIGNILLGDDGVGIRVIEALRDRGLPEEIELVDGGTCGVDLFYLFQRYDVAVVVDAARMGLPPGTIHRVRPEEVTRLADEQAFSAHDLGLWEAIQLGSVLHTLPPVHIIGVEPEQYHKQHHLSDRVSTSIEMVAQLAIEVAEHELGAVIS